MTSEGRDPTPSPADARVAPADAPVPLERDVFLRTLLRELSGVLQEVVGLDEAGAVLRPAQLLQGFPVQPFDTRDDSIADEALA